jgi:hypothetical protein
MVNNRACENGIVRCENGWFKYEIGDNTNKDNPIKNEVTYK